MSLVKLADLIVRVGGFENILKYRLSEWFRIEVIMDHVGEIWFERLHAYCQETVFKMPLSERESFSLVDEWRCRLIGGAFINWLENIGPQFLQERQVLFNALGVEPDSFIVFTSDVPGLVAAREIIGSGNDRLLYLSDKDYEEWIAQNPDEPFKWHIHVWSSFCDPIEKGFLKAAQAAFPITAGNSYWQHSEGTLWAPQAGRGVDHLWSWNEKEPELLEEAFQSRVF